MESNKSTFTPRALMTSAAIKPAGPPPMMLILIYSNSKTIHEITSIKTIVLFLQQLTGNDQLLYLGSAFINAQRSHIAVELLNNMSAH